MRRYLPFILIVCVSTVLVRNCDAQALKARTVINAHDASIGAIAFSPDGKSLVSGSADKTVKFWNVEDGKLTRILEDTRGVCSVALSPDGKFVASYGSAAKIWDHQSGQLLFSFAEAASPFGDVAFSPDGKSLAFAGSDRAIFIWETASCKLRMRLREPQAIGKSHTSSAMVQFCQNGKLLAAGCGNPKPDLALLDVGSGRTVRVFERGDLGLFSPDSKAVAHADLLGVTIWSLESGKEIKTLKGDANAIYSLAFIQNGRTLVTAGDGIRLWNIESGKCTFAVGGLGIITTLAISADGTLLASAGYDKTIRIWEILNAE